MEWFMLAVAGVLEVVWACAMKYSEGFSKTVPSVITGIGFLLSAVFLSLAVKKLPLGTAYAIWTGLGTMGTFALGVYLFSGAFLYPESHLRFAYLIRDCRLEIIALKRCTATASRRLRTGAENRAFPGPVPEPAEGGAGRVLLAEHARLIEPLARLATAWRCDAP